MENDDELLKAIRAKDKEAFEKTFDLYSSALYRYALRLGCDAVTADQTVGDMFVKLMEQLELGKGPETNLRTYLYQMTHHHIIDQARSSRRSAPLEVADWSRHEDSPSIALENQMMLDLILKLIQSELTDDQRQVIILYFIEGFSQEEIAAITGKKVNNVKVIQHRALAKLRKVI